MKNSSNYVCYHVYSLYFNLEILQICFSQNSKLVFLDEILLCWFFGNSKFYPNVLNEITKLKKEHSTLFPANESNALDRFSRANFCQSNQHFQSAAIFHIIGHDRVIENFNLFCYPGPLIIQIPSVEPNQIFNL